MLAGNGGPATANIPTAVAARAMPTWLISRIADTKRKAGGYSKMLRSALRSPPAALLEYFLAISATALLHWPSATHNLPFTIAENLLWLAA